MILAMVVEEVRLSISRDINGADLLYSLLNAPWLQSLLKVYACLQQYLTRRATPLLPSASALSQEALLSAHDTVAQKDYEPILPPLPDNLPDEEEAMRIVCLVKNKQTLGATIKRNEVTGEIVVARVIHGGLADRSGLLYAGDKLVEVNGVAVHGLEPEQVIQVLARSAGNIVFKLVPISDRPVNSQIMLYVRAMTNYCPQQDPAIPCADAGMTFQKGDILEIVYQNDTHWWQARKLPNTSLCAGLIPSSNLVKSYRFSLFDTYSRSSMLYAMESFNCMHNNCVPAGFRRSMRLCRRKSQGSQQSCYTRCASSCSSSVASPYEEVVRYQRHPEDRHRLIVLVGSSGVGVNELRKRLIEINPKNVQGPVPHTTRPSKSYEEAGREYHFVSKETFEHMVYNHRFLEYGEYKRHLYGTSIESVNAVLQSGKICIVDMEPQDEDFQEMEENTKKMEAQYRQFFDHVIVNENLQDSCVQFLSTVRRAQDEPQWVPATWLRPAAQS
ncbi:UNVERIFIED_CONTAM: hypothetical protein FKN15_041814 [Acipenser sinensis]